MFGLIRDFAITFFVILLSKFVYEVDNAMAYNFLVDFISGNQTFFLGFGVFCLVILLGFSVIFEQFGLYKITYGISKILVNIIQFLITFLSTLNILFYMITGGNFFLQSGYFTLIMLFLILGASCWTIRLNDFNYHTQNTLVPVGVFAVMSTLFVAFVWPVMGI